MTHLDHCQHTMRKRIKQNRKYQQQYASNHQDPKNTEIDHLYVFREG